MPKTARQEAAEMLTELLFRFYSAGQRHPRVTQGPKIHTHAFHVLYLLARAHDKRLSLSFLLTELQVTKQQLSKLINELEDFGYVERMRTGRDRRNVMLCLTESGERYYTEREQAVADQIAAFLEKYPPEKTEILHELLVQLGS